jgi:mRNA interferase MazF
MKRKLWIGWTRLAIPKAGRIERGEVVTVALQGDIGKPRPALVIQSDLFGEHASIVVLPLTSTLTKQPLFRITVDPSEENGLQKRSQIMVDKIQSFSREKIGRSCGRLDDRTMLEVSRAMAVFLGLA